MFEQTQAKEEWANRVGYDHLRRIVSRLPSHSAADARRVDVLRDDAAAECGSDALAGVLNFVLRDAPEGGTLEAR